MPFEYVGEAAALLTAVVWAISSQFHATATRLLGVGGVTLLRIPYHVLLLLTVYIIIRPQNTFSLEAALYIVAGAFCGIVFCDTAFYKAVDMLGPRLGCLLQSTSSCFTAIMGYVFLGESIGVIGALGIGVAIFGVFFVLADGGNLTVTHSGQTGKKELLHGAALGIFSAVALAGSLICTKQAILLGMAPLVTGIFRLFCGGLMLGAFFTYKGWVPKIWGTFTHTPMGWKFLLLGGLFSVTGVWMSGEAVKYAEAGVAATIIALEPVMIIPVNAIYERKIPGMRAIIGTFIAFGGIAMLMMR